MKKPINIANLPEFDLSEQLRDEQDVSDYLSIVLEDGDTDELIRAIGHIAKARGMTQIANETGLGRESLYKAFSAGSKPRFETVMKVLTALDIQLVAVNHSHS